MKLKLADTFNVELPADSIRLNVPRQVHEACFSFVNPVIPSNPKLIHTSDNMLKSIGLENYDKSTSTFLEIFSGSRHIANSAPYAMCYGGHQFGHWAGQLGDGRAINLGEVIHDNKRWALQLKGAGKTPYSRSADGLAVLRSSIREHLCSEAMHHLSVPTTRSLSLILSGDMVLRDIMYDGNADYEKGAIVCRVSPTFIRFGNFQIFAARKDVKNLKALTDYTIKYFFPSIEKSANDKYVQFFKIVVERTMEMVVHWQRVGFVHGVMNTDNMSILGLTIDYGPYGWLEGYDENWTPNTTDKDHRRYRFGNQPGIAVWNLAQLGSALVLLTNQPEPFQQILDEYGQSYGVQYLNMMRSKLGLQLKEENDANLISELTTLMQKVETDMTIFFRNISEFKAIELATNEHDIQLIEDAFYNLENIPASVHESWTIWLTKYRYRLKLESIADEERKRIMNLVNPKYVLRNYMAQLAIDKADEGDFDLISELHNLLLKPYDEQPQYEKWFAKRPEWARHKVGCSMLSCSS